MKLSELIDKPAGTMVYWAEARRERDPRRPELDYQAIHYERIAGGIRPKVFYAATYQAALEKAENYNRKRQEKQRQWRESAKQRREISKSSRTA